MWEPLMEKFLNLEMVCLIILYYEGKYLGYASINYPIHKAVEK